MINEQTGMFAPHYYPAFQCIADKCCHSCCMDWEICIDATTYARYEQNREILRTVQMSEDGPCFALTADGRCPHLNAAGLCDLILAHGESFLPEICREHPRFYNHLGGGRTELGLGIVCEEACRLLLETEAPFALFRIGDAPNAKRCKQSFDALPQRERMLAVLAEEHDFDKTIALLREEFAIPETGDREKWLDRFLALEILDAEWETLLLSTRGNFLQTDRTFAATHGKYYTRLLAYFIYRHVSTATSQLQLRARLAFAILSTAVIRSLFEAQAEQTLATLIDIARRYSAEIEYSEDNTAELMLAWECTMTIAV